MSDSVICCSILAPTVSQNLPFLFQLFKGADHLLMVRLICPDAFDSQLGTENESVVRAHMFSCLPSKQKSLFHYKQMRKIALNFSKLVLVMELLCTRSDSVR